MTELTHVARRGRETGKDRKDTTSTEGTSDARSRLDRRRILAKSQSAEFQQRNEGYRKGWFRDANYRGMCGTQSVRVWKDLTAS